MAQVRLRIAGLYFNEIVDMEEPGPWTVKQVMDAYQNARNSDPAFPTLSFDPDGTPARSGYTGSMNSITVVHPADANGNLVYKFYDFSAGVFTQNAGNGGLSLSREARPAGAYTLEESEFAQLNPTDSRDGVYAWQYYVQADNGDGLNRSKTLPGQAADFTPFGDADIVEAGDLITWRLVGILREGIAATV